jgi:hypothetical protein
MWYLTVAKQILGITAKKFIMKVLWSKDWCTTQPWAEDGEIQPYFSKTFDDRGEIHIHIYYIGPIGIIVGLWAED